MDFFLQAAILISETLRVTGFVRSAVLARNVANRVLSLVYLRIAAAEETRTTNFLAPSAFNIV